MLLEAAIATCNKVHVDIISTASFVSEAIIHLYGDSPKITAILSLRSTSFGKRYEVQWSDGTISKCVQPREINDSPLLRHFMKSHNIAIPEKIDNNERDSSGISDSFDSEKKSSNDV